MPTTAPGGRASGVTDAASTGSIPATSQCTRLAASMSVITSTSSTAPAGTPAHVTTGGRPLPSQVWSTGMVVPLSQGVCTANSAVSITGAVVVVVTIESVWSGEAGASERPS